MRAVHRILAVVAAALMGVGLLVVGTGSGAVEPRTASRVTATPIPTPVPPPTPTPRPPPSPCPEMTNPGGGLTWAISSDAGPWPTDGRVALPALGVDAPIVAVGVDRSEEMVVPGNARDVAWLRQGEFPGATMNAVLAGHINYNRRQGSFAKIGDLRRGDPVVVTMDGKRWEFAVAWVCDFDRNTHLADQIMGRTEVPSVTLITCGGTFDRRAGTHRKRMIVRAELVSVT